MANSESTQTSGATGSPSEALIAGKNLMYYWRVTRLFTFVLVLLVILNVVFDVYAYGHWIIFTLVYIILTYWLCRRSSIKLASAITASVIMGIVSGILLTVFDLIWHREWYMFLNFIRRPVILAVFGGVVTFVFYLLFQSFITNKYNKSDAKGGGIYGRKKERTKG